MDEEKRGQAFGKTLLLSAAAGVLAMALFLAAYYLCSSHKKNVFYEGEGRYTAVAASVSGLTSEFGGMEIELQSDGSCTVILGDKEKSGKWTRIGDRVELTAARQKMTGTLTGDRLEIMRGDSPTVISFIKEPEQKKKSEIPAGHWKLISITDGDCVYSEELLRKLGYDDFSIEIDGSGKGTADLFGHAENDIAVTEETISFNGVIFPFSFSENRLSINYAEGVILAFEQ